MYVDFLSTEGNSHHHLVHEFREIEHNSIPIFLRHSTTL